jgi:hypothetical protein
MAAAHGDTQRLGLPAPDARRRHGRGDGAAVVGGRCDWRRSTDHAWQRIGYQLGKVSGLIEWSLMTDLCWLTGRHLKSALVPADENLQSRLLDDDVLHYMLTTM